MSDYFRKRNPLAFVIAAAVALAFTVSMIGCSGSADDEAASAPQAPAGAESNPGDTVRQTTPAPEPDADADAGAEETAEETAVNEAATPAGQPEEQPVDSADAPEPPNLGLTVDEAHPNIASGALLHARLAQLPKGVLLRADALTITEADIAQQIAQAPANMREELKNYAFLLLEQTATGKLLLLEAGGSLDATGNENQIITDYLMKKYADIPVSDAEVEAFFKANPEMFGGRTLDQIKLGLKAYLEQQKQQEAFKEHIRTIGQRHGVEVDASWVSVQAPKATDNIVDRSRASGKPTFANFGADTCVPCQMMKPVWEAIADEYAGRVNIVYVHVNKQRFLAMRYGVQGIPCLIFFDKNGKEVSRRTGVMSKEEIEAKFTEMGVE